MSRKGKETFPSPYAENFAILIHGRSDDQIRCEIELSACYFSSMSTKSVDNLTTAAIKHFTRSIERCGQQTRAPPGEIDTNNLSIM
jgi:hypothetical protein